MRKPDSKILAAGVAAACVWMGTSAYAAGTTTISVAASVTAVCKFTASSSTLPLTIDPTSSATTTASDVVPYQCTKGTTPSFAFVSANSGNLASGTYSFSYAYSSSSTGAGTGFNGANSTQSLTVTASVDQSLAANVPPGSYTDTLTVTLTP